MIWKSDDANKASCVIKPHSANNVGHKHGKIMDYEKTIENKIHWGKW